MIGGGGHARVVIDVLRAAGRTVHGYTDPAGAPGDQLDGAPWLGDDGALESLTGGPVKQAAVALGENRARLAAGRRAEAVGLELITVVHPGAWISPAARLGRGVVVMAGAVVNAGAVIGDLGVINTGATVDHDCELEAAVHVAPGAHLAGCIRVGAGALIGVGAVVGRGRPLRIGAGAVVGSGAVALNDVGPSTTVIGNPARPLDLRPESPEPPAPDTE